MQEQNAPDPLIAYVIVMAFFVFGVGFRDYIFYGVGRPLRVWIWRVSFSAALMFFAILAYVRV